MRVLPAAILNVAEPPATMLDDRLETISFDWMLAVDEAAAVALTASPPVLSAPLAVVRKVPLLTVVPPPKVLAAARTTVPEPLGWVLPTTRLFVGPTKTPCVTVSVPLRPPSRYVAPAPGASAAVVSIWAPKAPMKAELLFVPDSVLLFVLRARMPTELGSTKELASKSESIDIVPPELIRAVAFVLAPAGGSGLPAT